MVASSDGFELAERDLEIRGGGALLGARQSGLSDLRFARITHDRDLLEAARDAARALAGGDDGARGRRAPRRGRAPGRVLGAVVRLAAPVKLGRRTGQPLSRAAILGGWMRSPSDPFAPASGAPVLEVFAGLSERSRRLRFLGAKPRLLESDLVHLVDVGRCGREAVAAVDQETGLTVGIAPLRPGRRTRPRPRSPSRWSTLAGPRHRQAARRRAARARARGGDPPLPGARSRTATRRRSRSCAGSARSSRAATRAGTSSSSSASAGVRASTMPAHAHHRRHAPGCPDRRAEGSRDPADRRPRPRGRVQPDRAGRRRGGARPLRRLGRAGARGALARRRERDVRRGRPGGVPDDRRQPRQAEADGRAGRLRRRRLDAATGDARLRPRPRRPAVRGLGRARAAPRRAPAARARARRAARRRDRRARRAVASACGCAPRGGTVPRGSPSSSTHDHRDLPRKLRPRHARSRRRDHPREPRSSTGSSSASSRTRSTRRRSSHSRSASTSSRRRSRTSTTSRSTSSPSSSSSSRAAGTRRRS